MKRTLSIAGAAVAALVAIVLGFVFLRDDKPADLSQDAVTISCIGGSEKSGLMADPKIQEVLAQKYGLTVDFQTQGSYDQVQIPTAELKQRGVDCLWPSSASAQLVFEAGHKTSEFEAYRAQTVLLSPEVIYAGPEGAAALTKAGLVKERDNKFFIVNMKGLLLDYVLGKKKWDDPTLAAKSLSGPVKIASTDPARSNSGFTLYQLKLTVVASDDPYQAPSVAQARAGLPKVHALYEAQGQQARSSEDGFGQWLRQGGEFSAPLYAGYESQVIGAVVGYANNKGVLDQLQKNVRILYPEPSIYSDHPVLGLTPDGVRLIDAMKDPEIQRIAWQTYGFRAGVGIGSNDVADFPSLPLADQVRVTAPPSADVTLMLLACIQQNKCS